MDQKTGKGAPPDVAQGHMGKEPQQYIQTEQQLSPGQAQQAVEGRTTHIRS